MTIEETVIAFVGGFIASAIILIWGVKIQKIEARNNLLKSALREFYPIVENLKNDLTYMSTIRSRAQTHQNQLDDIISNIERWFSTIVEKYSEFNAKGLEPELEVTNINLANVLTWIFHSWRLQGRSLILNEFDLCLSRITICENLLEDFLMSRYLRAQRKEKMFSTFFH